MTLQEILALRPTAGDSAALGEAVTKAERLRDEHAAIAAGLEQSRASKLLIADDRTILQADQDAAAARLVVQRLDALLPTLRADLAAADGSETHARLRTEAEATARDIEALQAWQATELPRVWEIIARGFALEDAAVAANSRLIANVKEAYQRASVRELWPLNVEVPAIPAARPRATFSAWARGN